MHPRIISSPPSEMLVQEVGDYITINCSANGSPLPEVKWLKDGRVISESGYNVQDLTMSKFIITSFKPSDIGLYTCRFYNKHNTTEATTNVGMKKKYRWSEICNIGCVRCPLAK